jgi:hypothetical protein
MVLQLMTCCKSPCKELCRGQPTTAAAALHAPEDLVRDEMVLECDGNARPLQAWRSAQGQLITMPLMC